MNNLALVTSGKFGDITCDFFEDNNSEFWMTREQIGAALEYSNPRKAIEKIHASHKNRFEKTSVVMMVAPPTSGGVNR